MESKRNQEDLYNITTYTDEELYEVLDLTKNPSDRELEAKILFYVHKYSIMDTKSSKKLAKFFDDIYNHFFENDSENEHEDADVYDNGEGSNVDEEFVTEGFESGVIPSKDAIINGNINLNNDGNAILANTQIPQNISTMQKSNQKAEVTFTKTLDYASGKLNPLIQQTIKRVISIDSKYRDNKQSVSTDFTFNLSEPLKDVVSLKLYSIQIPYTWYTVNSYFGGNFIYLKGVTPGIDNDYHDIMIDIPAGNYDQVSLTTALNSSIQTKKQIYSDVSFGNSSISINSNTSLTTSSFYLKKSYDENAYYLDFEGCGVSQDSSGVQVALGYTNKIHYPNTIISKTFNTSADPGFYSTGRYTIKDNCNNIIHIVKYAGPEEWVDISTNIPSRIDASFNIKIFDPNDSNAIKINGSKASRQNISDELNRVISNTPFFSSESGIKDPSYNTDPNNNTVYHYQTPGQYQLKIKPNRLTTHDISYSKVIIKFPYEDPDDHYNIWTGDVTSCFGFYNKDGSYWNEMSNVISEMTTTVNSGIYPVFNNTYIYLTCSVPGFDNSQNSITINIPSNTTGYTLDEYIAAINQGIATNSRRKSDNTLLAQGVISNSLAYKDNIGFFNLFLDIEQSFNETLYELDLRTSSMNNNLSFYKTNTLNYQNVIGNTYINNNVINGNININNITVGNINTITGLTGNITTNGNTIITSDNILINGNILTTNYISTNINNGNIVSKNNSSVTINGSTNMNLTTQVVTVDRSLSSNGNIVLTGNVKLINNVINSNITLISGNIISNGTTEITGNVQLNGLNNNNFTIVGDISTNGVITLGANTTITPFNTNFTRIASSVININGDILTTADLSFNYDSNNRLNNITTVNNSYSVNFNDANGIVKALIGTLVFGANINISTDAFLNDLANGIILNGTLSNGTTYNNTLTNAQITQSNSGSMISNSYVDISLNGPFIMYKSGNISINKGGIVTIRNANLSLNGNYTFNNGSFSYNSSFFGLGTFTGNVNIVVNSSSVFMNLIITQLRNNYILGTLGAFDISGQNVINYPTNIYNPIVVTGNFNSTAVNSYNSSFINQYGNLISSSNFSLNGYTTLVGNVNTTGNALKITCSVGKYISINGNLTSTDNLQIRLDGGNIENNNSGNVLLNGNISISGVYTTGNLNLTGTITTNSSIITTPYDVSINGIGTIIDASNININGNSIIIGTITGNNISISGKTLINGNIKSKSLARINLISGTININGSVTINGNTVTVQNNPDIGYITDLTQTYINTSILNTSYSIKNGDTIAIIKAKRNTGLGNDNNTVYNIIWTNPSAQYTNIFDYTNGINNAISNYIDPITGLYLFAGTKISATLNADKSVYLALNVKINKRLLSKNYNVNFAYTGINTWLNLNISTNMNSTFNLGSTVIDASWQNPISTVNNDGTVLITGNVPILVLTNAIVFNNTNNKFYLRAYENGVYSKNKENDITLTIPTNYYNTITNTFGGTIKYSVDTLVYAINQAIAAVSGNVNIQGTSLSLLRVTENSVVNTYAKFRINTKRTYNTRDYKLVFYDTVSFVKGYSSSSILQSISWDTTLGWLLGYHNSISYNFADYSSGTDTVTIAGDSVIILNLYNYFMICIDDYNSSQINDGLVTITDKDNNNPLPSYSSRANYQINPATGSVIYNANAAVDHSKLTQNQVYALTQVAATNQLNNSPDNKIYTANPSIKDVFALVPIKPGTNGQTFVEYGGTLQNQDRNYFGPVNISRMSVKLVTDKGDVLNLNGANWSFALICEQLSNLKPSK